MTLLDEHPLKPSGGIAADALIEEARDRQRRRRRWVAVVLAMLVAIGAAVAFNMNDRGHPGRRSTPSNSPAPTAPVSPLHNLPAEIVAAAYAPTSPTSGSPGWGTEVDLVSTRTGRVLRVLARGQVVVIAQAAGHVFFLQIPQQRTGYSTLREVAVSGGPVRTLGVGDMPTPSPNGRFLAYVRFHFWNYTSSLEVLDLATGTTTSMPLLPSFHAGVAALAWMAPGNRLALVVDPVIGPTQLMVVDLGPHQHLRVGQAESLPARRWVSLFRSSIPNTLLGAWVPALETSTLPPYVVQIQLSAHGVTIANVGLLPPSCAGGIDAIDPSGQDVLCSTGPLNIVRLGQGGYRMARSVSANHHVITSAAW